MCPDASKQCPHSVILGDERAVLALLNAAGKDAYGEDLLLDPDTPSLLPLMIFSDCKMPRQMGWVG